MSSITRKVADARKVVREFKELADMYDAVYWRQAERIFKLKDKNLWKMAYGDARQSWASFCVDELKLPLSTADHKAKTYDFFMRKHGFTHKELVGYDTHLLYYIALHQPKSSKSVVRDLMQQSSLLTRADFLAELRGDDCVHPHTHKEEEEKVVCDECNRVVYKKKKK